MELDDCTIGMLVKLEPQAIYDHGPISGQPFLARAIGHITGLTYNHESVICIVKMTDGETREIHPAWFTSLT